jgi:3-deoxy-7-phosphoheptulonate synthase
VTPGPDLDRWRALPIAQQPTWPDRRELDDVVRDLSTRPPLVFAGEVDALRTRLAAAAQGESFVLQGGDCAETFAAATADSIKDRVKTVLQMAVVLTYGASVPVVRLGRIAGQFAKPRSNDLETRGGVTLPAYRGDIVNGFEFTPEARRPDPRRLTAAYETAATTLNLVRAFSTGGFADLSEIHRWNAGFAAAPVNTRYRSLADEIGRAIEFMQAWGSGLPSTRSVEYYSSHEALLLEYDRALTRIDSRTGDPYVLSAHSVWIGERTRDLTGAHVDFLSQVRNPIGVKLGPSTDRETVLRLMDALDPRREPGRLTFITRMGAGRIREKLPALLEAVRDEGSTPVWICDPMHGNGITTESGYKTRRFDDVVSEVEGFFACHAEAGTVPGGLHVELSGDDVTECLGGSDVVSEADLSTRYESQCDPRLNHAQSLELSFLVAELLKQAQRRS